MNPCNLSIIQASMSPKVGDFKGVCGDPRNELLSGCDVNYRLFPPSRCSFQVRFTSTDEAAAPPPLGRALAPLGGGVPFLVRVVKSTRKF